jgi:DNA modification methylase
MTIQVQVFPVDNILVAADRQRKDPSTKHIEELAKSIERDGLIHALAITDGGELISGFCRLSAIKLLQAGFTYGDQEIPAGYAPCLVMSGRDEPTLFRLELEENLRRKNLSPVEEAQAIAHLHQMMEREAPSGTWTKTDTGRKLDEIRGDADERGDKARHREVADAVLLDSFSKDPDVARASTKAEAIKIAKKKLESTFMQSLGQLQTLVSSDFTILEGDCRSILLQTPSDQFHGIITDPPYGMGADEFGAQSFGHEYNDDEASAMAVAIDILAHGRRVCKESAHLYMFCDIRYWSALTECARTCGWQPYATPLIWHKPNVGHAPQPGFFLRRYEALMFARKGNRTLQRSSSDVLEFPAELAGKTHAAQKPVALYKFLMDLSFLPGESVLDPCAGSGTIFKAAKQSNLRATGIEMSPTFAAHCKLVIGEL